MAEATLSVDILANTSNLTAGMQTATNSVKQFEMTSKAAATAMDALKASFAPLLALTGLAAPFVAIAKAFSDIGEMGGFAKKLDMSVESFSALSNAAKKTGVDTETFGGALMHLTKTLGDAELGGEKAIKAFNMVGIDFTKMANLSGEDKLLAISNVLKEMPDRAQQVAASIRLLGDEGPRMLPLLLQGATGIQELMDKAKASGNVVSGETVANYKKFTSALKEIKDTFSGVFMSIAADVAPYLAEAGNSIREWLEEGREIFAEWKPILDQMGAVFSAGLKVIVELFTEAWSLVMEGGRMVLNFFGIQFIEGWNDFKQSFSVGLSVIEYLVTHWKETIILAAMEALRAYLYYTGLMQEAITGTNPFAGMVAALDQVIGPMKEQMKKGMQEVILERQKALDAAEPNVWKKFFGDLGNGAKAVADIKGQVLKDDKEKSSKSGDMGAGYAERGSSAAANEIVKAMMSGDSQQIRLMQQGLTEQQRIQEILINGFGKFYAITGLPVEANMN